MFRLGTMGFHEAVMRHLVSQMTAEETPALGRVVLDRVKAEEGQLAGLHAGAESKTSDILKVEKCVVDRERRLTAEQFARLPRVRTMERLRYESKAEKRVFLLLNSGDHKTDGER